MDLGPHALFIWLCYGAVAIMVGGMIVALHIDGRRLERALAELEVRGIKRVGSELAGDR